MLQSHLGANIINYALRPFEELKSLCCVFKLLKMGCKHAGIKHYSHFKRARLASLVMGVTCIHVLQPVVEVYSVRACPCMSVHVRACRRNRSTCLCTYRTENSLGGRSVEEVCFLKVGLAGAMHTLLHVRESVYTHHDMSLSMYLGISYM